MDVFEADHDEIATINMCRCVLWRPKFPCLKLIFQINRRTYMHVPKSVQKELGSYEALVLGSRPKYLCRNKNSAKIAELTKSSFWGEYGITENPR